MSVETRHLGEDMRSELVLLDVQVGRQCVRSILDSALTSSAACHGGISPDNIVYTGQRSADNGFIPQAFSLGGSTDVMPLWDQWVHSRSSNVAYIPPEAILGTGDQSKVDSWAVGCLAIQLLNCGKQLRLKRQLRHAPKSEYLYLNEADVSKQLKEFYNGAGETGLVVGPDTTLLLTVPYAGEEFLARSLETDPTKRWSLQQLRDHAFLNMEYSLEQLFAMDSNYYQTLPILQTFTVNNIRAHPFLAATTKYTILLADSPTARNSPPSKSPVELWRFPMMNETADRDLYTKAYGKLLDLLPLEECNDEAVVRRTVQRASFHRIRALQQGHQNIVRHFGCQFAPQPNSWSPQEFIVFTEHCAGGNFQQAAAFHLTFDVMHKWVEEMLHGLDFLHKHGIVHRNLNSAIVFFSEPLLKGTVKIGGFHNMRQLGGTDTQRHEISARKSQDGRFVSPEISNAYNQDVNVGRKCDIWSLACVVLHLATGQPPLYTGPSGKVIDSEMAVIYHLNEKKNGPAIPDWLPASVGLFIDKCLQFDPARRPTAADLLKEQQSALIVDEVSAIEYHNNRSGNPLPQQVISYWTRKN